MMAHCSLSRQVWDMKYRLKTAGGEPVDQSVEDTWRRVARSLAAVERSPDAWERRFYDVLRDFRFLPAGRIVSGAGTDRRVTLFNCFVMGVVPDSMGGIFEHLREAALTLQQGGGIGYDFSTLRPHGALVEGVGADASGPLSFMEVWDAMCRTIMSAGARRGAMMATLRCDHPDIESFIDAKREPGRLTNFNLSVLVTDAFMAAVRDDRPWTLAFGGKPFREIRARALWDRIMQATYDTAEPGVIFIDRINQANNLHYCETIAATNPCGEQPLPPYGACLLGSVNLAALVEQPFTDAARLDLDTLAEITGVAVRLLDNAIDASKFPLEAQAQEASAKRRIGLGITGLADALLMCRVRYGSSDAVQLTERWMDTIRRAAYRASVDLAREKGPFPLFDAEAYLAGESIQSLDADLREAIRQHGIRNALLTSIAPTGTISLFADNVSSGLEPVFSFSYTRTVLMPDGERRQETVSDHAVRRYQALHGTDAPLPDYFVDAQTLSPADHLVMQAAAQKYVDSSISKTINVPESIPFEAFKDVYRQAYDLGCKGCTTYRPTPLRGSVLSVTPAAPPQHIPMETQAKVDGSAVGQGAQDGGIVYMTEPLLRPEALPGQTYKLRWPGSDHALYITLNDIEQDGRRRPFEIFVNSKNMEHYAWTVALTRMISAVFRRGGDVSFVVEELQAVFDPRGGAWMHGRYVPSLLAAIGDVIEQHLREIGFLPPPEEDAVPARILAAGDADAGLQDAAPGQSAAAGRASAGRTPAGRTPAGRFGSCPRCGQPTLSRQEGCDLCTNCGYSRCG